MPKYELFTTGEVPDLDSLRSYVGSSKAVSVSDYSDGGLFVHDETDNSTAHDGENVIVDYKGRRWKRASAANFQFLQSGTGAVARTAQDKMREVVSVLDFIPEAEHAAIKAGTSTYDCTNAIAAAFAAHDAVDFGPQGWLFNVSQISLAANKSFVTHGRGPTIQQISGQPAGTSLVRVEGSNVAVGSLKGIGNIATDTAEFNHIIECFAGRYGAGNIENITIGDVYAKDVRGDGVCIGQYALSPGSVLKNVHIGNVFYDNVLRNGVSIVSGDTITVASVQPAGSNACGFCAIDIEADVGSGTCRNVKVGLVKGRHLGLVSQSAADYIENSEIAIADLSPSYSGVTTPVYAGSAAIADDALLLRNVKSVRIDAFKASGYNRCAGFVTYNVGELGCQDLEIGTAVWSDCSNTDATYNTYFSAASLASNNLRIRHLDLTIDASGKNAILNAYSGRIDSVKATMHADSYLLRGCQDMQVANIQQSGGYLGLSCTRVSFSGGEYSGSTMFAFNTDCALKGGLTATASVALFTGNTGNTDHKAEGVWLNGVYTDGSTAASGSGYLKPMKLGNGYLWVSSDGKVRVNTSVPASDTDGTVVGTQS